MRKNSGWQLLPVGCRFSLGYQSLSLIIIYFLYEKLLVFYFSYYVFVLKILDTKNDAKVITFYELYIRGNT
jgi:hypothetical protein